MYASDKDIEMLDQLIDKIEEGLKRQGISYKRLNPTREQKEQMLGAVNGFLKKTKDNGNYPGIEEDIKAFARSMAALKAEVIANESRPTAKPKMSIGEFFDSLKAKQNQSNPVVQEEQGEDVCTCPACLNYHNFEEKLRDRPGKFDKTKFLLGGKVFHAKSFTPLDNSEDLVVLEKEENLKIEDFATLKRALEAAIKDGDMQGAQNILDRMSNLKK